MILFITIFSNLFYGCSLFTSQGFLEFGIILKLFFRSGRKVHKHDCVDVLKVVHGVDMVLVHYSTLWIAIDYKIKILILVKTNGLWSYKTIFKQSKQKNMSTNFFSVCRKKISALLISNLLSKYFLERSFLSHFSYRWEPGDLKYVVPI